LIADPSTNPASVTASNSTGWSPDLPIQQQANFQLAINLKTAEMLGLKVPRDLMAIANVVIE